VEFLFENLKTETEKIELIAALIERIEDPSMRAEILGRFKTDQLDPLMILPVGWGIFFEKLMVR